MLRRTLLASLGTLLSAAALMAQVPAEERIPITDPDRLQRLGFPRDARNIFVWSRADRDGAGPGSRQPFETTKSWGIARHGFTTVQGYELQEGWHEIRLGRYPEGGTFCVDNGVGGGWAWAQVDLPEGASLDLFRSWAYDADPDQDLTFEVWETCQPYGYDPPTHTLIAENFTIGSIGYYPGNKSLNGLTVSNELCTYSVEVHFATYPQDCRGDDLRMLKFQFTWNRQVSPAPSTATFNDVPTSHPFFQFVEALSKSEITGGCSASPPLYCPDAPLTRGQMAVFLAKALGLQWP